MNSNVGAREKKMNARWKAQPKCQQKRWLYHHVHTPAAAPRLNKALHKNHVLSVMFKYTPPFNIIALNSWTVCVYALPKMINVSFSSPPSQTSQNCWMGLTPKESLLICAILQNIWVCMPEKCYIPFPQFCGCHVLNHPAKLEVIFTVEECKSATSLHLVCVSVCILRESRR